MLFREGSRPSGCPRPMRRGWLRRNRLPEPSGTSSCRRVLCLSIRLGVFPISSVESQSGGLGHKNATIARRALQILRLLLGWDTGTAYTGKYPIPLDGNSPLSDCRFADFGRQQAAKLDGKQHRFSRGKIVTRYTSDQLGLQIHPATWYDVVMRRKRIIFLIRKVLFSATFEPCIWIL